MAGQTKNLHQKSVWRGVWSPSLFLIPLLGIPICTIFIIIFLSGINLVIEYTVNCAIRGYISSAKQELNLVCTFMDDMNLMAGPVKDTRCTKALTWARMRYNISKPRSFVVKRGKFWTHVPLLSNLILNLTSSRMRIESFPSIVKQSNGLVQGLK